MKKIPFIIGLILTFLTETAGCLYFLGKLEHIKQDSVAVNECLYSISENWGEEEKYSDILSYTVLDNAGNIIYTNKPGMSESINEAIRNCDLILDLKSEEEIIGKVIFDNQTAEMIAIYRDRLIRLLVAVAAVQILILLLYYIYLRRNIIRPFQKLSEFAVRVASGNLDIPLLFDKKHMFGGFTEAFDLMRSELKKARIAEKKANDEKKEMVAKLSHDIKTPVASIKSTSEVGICLTNEERIQEKFILINRKSDQITALVDNLFHASVEEITELAVNPGSHPSELVAELIKTSDFLGKSGGFQVPPCRIYADRLRLQQVFDNIFMNSYKYADTAITVNVSFAEDYLVVSVADKGGGVSQEELPVLKEKYKRGNNARGEDGAGLGLYLADYFLERMDGKLTLDNIEEGLEVSVYLRVMNGSIS